MFKKIIFVLITIIFSFNTTYIMADDKIEEENIVGADAAVCNEMIAEAIETTSNVTDEPKINSRAAIVIDRNSKAILYGKNENSKRAMASTTKIMTAMVVIQNTNLNNIVEISKKAAGTGGSRLKIKAGDKITVRDLLYGLLLRSGNDAAVALAEYVGGSVEEFANLMNENAKQLNLKNTHFVTPHGLDSEDHYTTAYELAILTDYALNNKVFAQIVNTKSIDITINGQSRTISNTNELLGNLDGVYGVKTGFTNGAGRCLVTSIKRRDLDIICVVLGADTKKHRTRDSINLIEYVYSKFENANISEQIEQEFYNWSNINSNRINIEKGIKKDIKIKLEEYNLKDYPIEKGTESKINIEINSSLNLKAPVKEETPIGEVAVFYDNHIILKIKVLTAEGVRKKGIVDYIFEMSKNYSDYLEKVI